MMGRIIFFHIGKLQTERPVNKAPNNRFLENSDLFKMVERVAGADQRIRKGKKQIQDNLNKSKQFEKTAPRIYQ